MKRAAFPLAVGLTTGVLAAALSWAPLLARSVTDTPPPPVCDCSQDIYNCADFDTQPDAQSCFNYCQEVVGGDVHHLDNDGDGIPCESLSAAPAQPPAPTNTAQPEPTVAPEPAQSNGLIPEDPHRALEDASLIAQLIVALGTIGAFVLTVLNRDRIQAFANKVLRRPKQDEGVNQRQPEN
jgi:hypothetical protein